MSEDVSPVLLTNYHNISAAISDGDEIATSYLDQINIPYTVCECVVAILAVVGNAMVIFVFQRERRLRRRTNYYIVSLAIADLLVGLLGIPFALLAAIGLPNALYPCLFSLSILVVLCTTSIFCLVAVSVDRYWAILHPMAYSRNVRTKTAIIIIAMCWVAGGLVGFLPVFGVHESWPESNKCYFVQVMSYNYLVFLYFATIITPAVLLLAFYAHIYRVIIRQVRQIVTMNPGEGITTHRISAGGSTASSKSTKQTYCYKFRSKACKSRSQSSGTMLRVLGAAQKREVKATQNLSIIVLFFMICWIPLYTINCIMAFCRTCHIDLRVTLSCIVLSHFNSAVNPFLYAYHLRDFRAALKNFIMRVFGMKVPLHQELNGRPSLQSQHQARMASMVEKRNSLQPRIYIDSPVWLRSQQPERLTVESGTTSPNISKSLTCVHQTVAAIARSATETKREMWNIIEVPSTDDSREYHDIPNAQIDRQPSIVEIDYHFTTDLPFHDAEWSPPQSPSKTNHYDNIIESDTSENYQQQTNTVFDTSSEQNIFLIDSDSTHLSPTNSSTPSPRIVSLAALPPPRPTTKSHLFSKSDNNKHCTVRSRRSTYAVRSCSSETLQKPSPMKVASSFLFPNIITSQQPVQQNIGTFLSLNDSQCNITVMTPPPPPPQNGTGAIAAAATTTNTCNIANGANTLKRTLSDS